MKNSYSVVDFKEQFGTGEEAVGKLQSQMIELKLSGNSLFKEFFSNTEASAMVPVQFLAQVVLGATSNPLLRAVFPVINKDSGESIWIRRASEEVDAQVVNEGAEALIDATDYEKSEFVYNKIMKRPMWSYEALADTPIDLIGINNQLMGARVTLKEDQIGLADLYYWSSAARATAYTNTIGTTGGQSYLENLIDAVIDLPGDSEGFYKASAIITDASGYSAIVKDTNVLYANQFGSIGFVQTGELSIILGCKVYVRTLKSYGGDYQKPAETLSTDTVSTYIIDTRFTAAVIDRVPLTIDSWNIEARQLANANVWERTILGIIQPRAYRRMTARTS